MSRKRLILLLGIGLLMAQRSNAQNQPALGSGSTDSKLLPSSLGASNMGSAFSPDLFNGTANISIPIYSYGNNGVSLSYNTAGIQVDEPAGFIGQHWNLQASGSISRILKDVPDELNVAESQMSNLDGSGDPSAASGIKGKFSQYGLGNTSSLDAGCYVDDESDDFIFSVGGFSFTFNIGNNGFIFTNPHKNVQIDLLLNGQVVSTTGTQIPSSGNFEGLQEISFRVRDAQGNWYYFQKGDVSHMSYGPKTGPTLGYDYITKWVLQKIVENDGKVTKYTYTTQSPSATIIYDAFTSLEPASQITNTSEADAKANESLKTYSRLESISYPNQVNVSFIYTVPTGGRCDMGGISEPIMSEIQVGSAGAVNRYVFEQAYAVAPNENTYLNPPPALTPLETSLNSCVTITTNGVSYGDGFRYHRLILKGIHIANADSTQTQPYYKFGYNRSTTLRLPAKLNNGQDYFGFYNGKSAIYSGYGYRINIPNHQNVYSSGAWPYGVDKTDDAHYAQADLLNLMVNAYGGQTYFYYGAHELSNVLANGYITAPTDNYFMGVNANDGVRLDSIITKDPHYPGVWQVERFAYSGGERFMPGGYFNYPASETYTPTQPNILFNSSYVSPHQFVNGSNHGYTVVTDTTLNNSNQILGIKSTFFRNISEGPHITSYYMSGSKQYFQIPFTNKQYIKDWQIGLPSVITEYDAYKNIVSRTTNTYQDYLDATSSAGNVENLHRLAMIGTNSLMVTVDSEFYHPFTGTSLLVKTVSQKFVDDATSINDTVTYTYDDHNNLATTTATNSQGEQYFVSNIYNYNVSGPNVLTGGSSGTLYNMTSVGLEIQVGMERWKQGSGAIYNNSLYDANITKYKYENGLLNAQKLYTLQALDPISYTSYTGITMGGPSTSPYNNILTAYNSTSNLSNFQVASEVIQFDAKNNPLETQLKGQNSFISMMWDTTNYNKIVDVQNARLVDIGYTSFEHFSGVSYGNGTTTTDGGFTFHDQGHVEGGLRVTGTGSFKLVPSGSTSNNYITSPTLTAGKSYVLTFWAKGVSTTVVPIIKFLSGGTTTNVSPHIAYTAPNGWINYSVDYTSLQTGNLQVTTTNTVYMDEMRLFPTGAMMKSWTYSPLLGATSSTDPSGRVTYYEYDTFGRLVDTKDQEGNITSKKEYRVAQ